MSLKRRQLELQRCCRNKSVRYISICLLFCIALFGFSKLHDQKTVDNVFKTVQRDDNPWDSKELPGGTDPGAVFQAGVLGNYEPNVPEKVSDQPGENGEPVRITDEEGRKQGVAAVNTYGFNTYVSDMISMNRTIPDIRMEECKHWHYPEELPTVSVVIVFHNEGWTPLLRTVNTVLLRSPPHILKEIVMVDDDSNKEHLQEKLEKYITRFGGKVKLVRTGERFGLIRARTFGATHSTADVLIFLDAHCEVNTNWLPPLLSPIKNDRHVMTVPVIDGIDSETWEYHSVYGGSGRHFSGIFEWGLLYKETEISDREKNSRSHDSMPFRSPTHAGGLFAIDRLWFKQLGHYDEGLQIWGGEQYELSFKIWQCGGGILFVPCSHVGHVYRSHMPYNFGKLSGKPVVSTNMMRVIKTWMGEYEKYYFIREPQTRKVDPGDISAQLALKDNLKCKDFKWYMDNVAYDVLKSYPLLPDNHVWGEARNTHSGYCLDRTGGIPGQLSSYPCHGYGGNQLLRLNLEGQMAQGEWCLTPNRNGVQANHCQKGNVGGPWKYDEQTRQIMTKARQCLTIRPRSNEVVLERCDASNELQKFEWKEFYQAS